MTRHFSPPIGIHAAPTTLLVDAIRCWSEARNAGRPAQPSLFRMLDGYDCAMLTPVLDSLIHLFQIGLGSIVRIGLGPDISEDEHLLLDLVDGRFSRSAVVPRDSTIGTVLDCALRSVRIMLAFTLVDRSIEASSGHRLQ